MIRYLFGPEASPLERTLAWFATGLLVCACGLCGVTGTAAGVMTAQEELATQQARPTATLTPTITPIATATLVPTFTPTAAPLGNEN